jgi:hypothetical protein
MRKSLCYLINTILFLSIYTLYAQNNKEKTNLEVKAKYYFDNRIYYTALSYYQELDSLYPNTEKYIYPLGICYLNTNFDEFKAIPYLEKCAQSPHKFPKTLHYYLGKAYHLSHNFTLAITHYEWYLSYLYHKPKQNKLNIIDIERNIEMCKTALIMVDTTTTEYKIQNLGTSINSKFPEYAPVVTADEKEIIFTSSRPNTTGGKTDPFDGHFYEDIYITYKTDSGWTQARLISDSINTNNHDASVSLSNDGSKLIIYKFVESINPLNSGNGGLYVSELKGKEWSKPSQITGVNSNYYEPSGQFIKNENYFIFSSNQPGGFGGLDLYISKKLRNGNWGIPINLGPEINSKYDEDAPYLHPDEKTLYFSSNGHQTIGGFDIFYSTIKDSTFTNWGKPTNIGFPINSAHDDLHFTISPNGKKIYFSTVRPDGFGDKDIYYAEIKNQEDKHVLVYIGRIRDSLTNVPIEATLKVYDKISNELIGIYKSNSESGKYIMVFPEGGDFIIETEATNYKICNNSISTLELNKYEEINKDISLCPNQSTK